MAEPQAAVVPAVLRDRIIEALKTVFDPEIPVNIYDLGLIYGVEVQPDGRADIQMTLTTPHCIAAQILPGQVEMRAKMVPGVSAARVHIVWEPPWTKDMMSEEARMMLGI